MARSKVYFIREITPENLVRIYDALGQRPATGRVAVKLSTGEPGRPSLPATGFDCATGAKR